MRALTKPNYATGRFALWGLVILLGLGQLQRLDTRLFSLPVTIYFHDLFICGWLLTMVATEYRHISRYFSQLKQLEWRRLQMWQKTGLILLGWTAGGVLLQIFTQFSLTPLLYISRLVAYSSFALTLPLVFQKPIEKVDLRERPLIAGLVIAVAGLLQYVFLPDTRFLSVFGWDDHYYRLISTLLDPAFTGIVLVISWCYLRSVAWIAKHPMLLFSLHGLLAVAIGLTFSRATYLAFGFALALGAVVPRTSPLHRRALGALVFSAVVCTAALVLAPKPTGEGVNLARTSTIVARTASTRDNLQQFSAKTWLVGNGLFSSAALKTEDRAGVIDHARLPNSLPVLLVQAVGLPGLALAALLLITGLPLLWRADPWYTVALVAVLVHAQFNNTLFEPFVGLFLLLGAASLLRLESHQD